MSHDAKFSTVDIIGGLRAPFPVGTSVRVHLRLKAPVNAVTSKSSACGRLLIWLRVVIEGLGLWFSIEDGGDFGKWYCLLRAGGHVLERNCAGDGLGLANQSHVWYGR